MQAEADDSNEPLAAAPVFARHLHAHAPRGVGGGGLNGYLQAIPGLNPSLSPPLDASSASNPTKLKLSGLFKYCQGNLGQTAAVGLGLVAVGGFAATGVALSALALGAEVAVTATVSALTGLLTSASASAAVVKVNKSEIIEHVANQEERARLERMEKEGEIADVLRKRHDMANEDISKVILKIAMLFVAANESK